MITYKWEEIQTHNTSESPWLVVHGKVYDVSNFQHVHPGEMILMAVGRKDGTEMFESHHPLWVKDSPFLKDCYIGEVEGFQEQYSQKTNFHQVLKERVEEYFKKSNIKFRDSKQMYFKAIFSWILWIYLYYLSFYGFHSYIATALITIVWGWSVANVGMFIMHDGNHGAFSNSAWINKLTGSSFDILGGSSYVWKMIHSVGHHVHTNVEEKDPDINTKEPHFRKIKKRQIDHWWYQYQHYYLLPLYSLLIFELFFRDIIAMLKCAWGGTKFQPIPRNEWILFIICKIWYLSYNFFIPLYLNVPLSKIIMVYIIVSCVASEILVLMFQVNHVTDKATFYNVDKDNNTPEDWAIVQVQGSSNFSSGSAVWNFLSGGLNHQIEHHLFPYISHVHYPAMSGIVKKTCQEFNVQYNEYDTFLDAINGHIKLLKDLGKSGISYRPKIE